MRNPQDWGQPCPTPDCSPSRLMPRGTLRALATSMTHRGTRRIFRCRAWARPCSETRGTVVLALRTPADQGMLALQRRLGNGGLSDRGFGLGVTQAPVWEGRRRAAQTAHAIKAPRLRAVPVPQGPREAMGRFMRRQHAPPAGPDGERPARSDEGRPGGWSRFAPAVRRILAAWGGPRTFQRALPLLQITAAVVLGGPCFGSDGCRGARLAGSAVSPPLQPCPHTGKPGRPTQPVQEPPPAVGDGQGGTKQRQGRLPALISRVCCGSRRLERGELSSSTRLLACLPLTLRPALAPLVRTRWGCGTERTPMRRRVVLWQAVDHFARPHMRGRLPLSEQAAQAAGRIQPTGGHHTPGMAVGLTDPGWTLRELLTAKFAPIHHQSGSG